MRIDYEYLKNVLDVFLDSPLPDINSDSFSSFYKKLDDGHKFIFHMEILADKGLIRSRVPDGSLGMLCDDLERYVSLGAYWRLTADGHDFAAALNKPTVMAIIKDKFKEDGISAVIDIAKTLVVGQIEKRLGEIAT